MQTLWSAAVGFFNLDDKTRTFTMACTSLLLPNKVSYIVITCLREFRHLITACLINLVI
jgi:hypothetical protein